MASGNTDEIITIEKTDEPVEYIPRRQGKMKMIAERISYESMFKSPDFEFHSGLIYAHPNKFIMIVESNETIHKTLQIISKIDDPENTIVHVECGGMVNASTTIWKVQPRTFKVDLMDNDILKERVVTVFDLLKLRLRVLRDIGKSLRTLHSQGMSAGIFCLSKYVWTIDYEKFCLFPFNVFDITINGHDDDFYRYAAWELIQTLTPNDKACPETDVYAFGLLMFELFYQEKAYYLQEPNGGMTGYKSDGAEPYCDLVIKKDNAEAHLSFIYDPPSHYWKPQMLIDNPDLFSLMHSCLSLHADRRPSLDAINTCITKHLLMFKINPLL